jgi:hypothetical protein
LSTTAPAETATEDGSNDASGDGTVAGLPAAAGIPAAATDADARTNLTATITARKSRCCKWTLQENTTLTRAVQTHGSNNWTTIAALVPGRTKNQCKDRWHHSLNSTGTDQTPGHAGKWTADEVKQLKDAVQRHGSNNWTRITALIPGRTKKQCTSRWHHFLNSTSTDQTPGRIGKWTADEDAKLNDSVQRHGGKNWIAITALVPGRTKTQCNNRWHDALGPNVDRTSLATGKWNTDEDNQLKDALQRHGSNNWTRIAALVPGRSKIQCSSRWHNCLDSSNTDQTPGRTGIRWTADEDNQLKNAIQRHGSNNWATIAALVPGRTKKQCSNRWHNNLDSSVDRTSLATGKWTADEVEHLKDAVQRHGTNNWTTIAALVPGRTKRQCSSRWHENLNYTSTDQTPGRAGKWTADEDNLLKDVVQRHGGKNWMEIAVLVPGRTKVQCTSRWHKIVDSTSIDQTPGRTGIRWTTDEDNS